MGFASPEGFFCDGICTLTTPDLAGFNRNSYTVRLDFLVTKPPPPGSCFRGRDILPRCKVPPSAQW
jgi:hypothetical protein